LKITQPAQVLVSVDEVVPVNEAVAYFAGVIARDRRNEIALNLLSIAHREAGNLDAAIEDANCAIACRPGYATALINRASARLKKLEINAALADYDEAIRRDPRLPDAYAMRGFVMLHIKKELGKALADFDEAIRLDPRYSLALVNRAALRLIRGEPDLAIADATNAILVAPDDASPFSIRATAWGSKANWELALADFNEAIRIQPTKFNFYVSRGTVWRMLDKFDLAIGDFATAISLAPDELGGYQGLLEVLLDNENVKYRDFKRAVEVGRRACEVTQWKNPDCLATLAAACFETGQAAEAVNYQKQALALTPLNHEKTQRRHDALKRYQEALDTASKR
jgi:tetratricopeptide (TPR) repeat protein